MNDAEFMDLAVEHDGPINAAKATGRIREIKEALEARLAHDIATLDFLKFNDDQFSIGIWEDIVRNEQDMISVLEGLI